MTTRLVQARVPEEDHRFLCRLAGESGISVAAALRRMIAGARATSRDTGVLARIDDELRDVRRRLDDLEARR